MSTNKHARIRYQALDICFSNFGRKYDINALVQACNQAIYDYDGKCEGVKRRQAYDDIKLMESIQGWHIELAKIKEYTPNKPHHRHMSRPVARHISDRSCIAAGTGIALWPLYCKYYCRLLQ